MSWKPEVEVFGEEGVFTRNGMAFATQEEAEKWAVDLSFRWMLVKSVRAVEVDSNEYPVNYRITEDNVLEPVGR